METRMHEEVLGECIVTRNSDQRRQCFEQAIA